MGTVPMLTGLFGFLVGNFAHACSVGPAPPATRVEPSVVVFSGVVEDYVDVGYALPMDLIKGKSTPAGLKVRVTEGVTRAQVGSVVDVYPNGHGPDCKSLPYDIDKVRERYHAGATVAVVAYSEPGAVEYPTVVSSYDIGNHGIAIVPTDYPRTANGTMDFAKVSKVSREGAESIDHWKRLYAARAFQHYQTYKSLVFLGSAVEESRKVLELSNIRYYYGYQCMIVPYARNAFIELVHNVGLSESTQARVLAEIPTDLPNDFYAIGYQRWLKGTVFEGYCEND